MADIDFHFNFFFLVRYEWRERERERERFTSAGARIGAEDDAAIVSDADDGGPHRMR